MAWNALVNPLTKQFYPDLIPGGGGGGQVNSITGGAGINIAGTAVNPQVNLAFTATAGAVAGTLFINNLPTSNVGLTAGAVWNNSGVLNIV